MLKAITNKIVVQIKYYDHEHLVLVKFEPIRLIYHRGTIHLIGFHYRNSDKSIQVIELDSIVSVIEIDKRFKIKGIINYLILILNLNLGFMRVQIRKFIK